MNIDIDSEDKLALNISDRYFSRWVCQQLPGWRAWAATCRLPASSLQGGKQYKAAQTDLQFEFPMFSTTGMIWMLLRWASTLKAVASREVASNFLRGLTTTALPATMRFHVTLELPGVWPTDCWPCMPQRGAAIIECRDAVVEVASWCQRVQPLRAASMRSEWV